MHHVLVVLVIPWIFEMDRIFRNFFLVFESQTQDLGLVVTSPAYVLH